jgi:hypothetical protein
VIDRLRLLLGNMVEAFRIRIKTRISANNEEDLSITMTITGVVEDPTIKRGTEGTRISISKIATGGPEAEGTKSSLSKIATGGPEAHLIMIGGKRQRSNP